MKTKPFLRWVGGKRWLTSNYPELFPTSYNKYIEPFLGSGSVFFHMQPHNGLLGDLNKELVNTYNVIKDKPEQVLIYLQEHDKHHSKEYYYNIRNKRYRSLVKKAAQFIYLNRTCFNGVYRVNKKGEFNVPFGSKINVLRETDDFNKVSELLTNVNIEVNDFQSLIDQANNNDFIFADPPYTVTHNNNGFIHYNEKLFHWDDQVRLAESLIAAKDRGAKILSTNAYHQDILKLYENDFNLIKVSRFSGVSGKTKHRNTYDELVIKSY